MQETEYLRGKKNYQRTEYDDCACESWEEDGKFISQIISKNKSMKKDIKIFLKQNWLKLTLVTIILTVMGGTFYWYEWRPAKIKHDCSWVQSRSDDSRWERAPKVQYDFCIHEKGL